MIVEGETERPGPKSERMSRKAKKRAKKQCQLDLYPDVPLRRIRVIQTAVQQECWVVG